MSEIKKARPVGRPPVNATPITVRVPPELLAVVDDWRSKKRPIPSRPEAIRMILAEKLRDELGVFG